MMKVNYFIAALFLLVSYQGWTDDNEGLSGRVETLESEVSSLQDDHDATESSSIYKMKYCAAYSNENIYLGRIRTDYIGSPNHFIEYDFDGEIGYIAVHTDMHISSVDFVWNFAKYLDSECTEPVVIKSDYDDDEFAKVGNLTNYWVAAKYIGGPSGLNYEMYIHKLDTSQTFFADVYDANGSCKLNSKQTELYPVTAFKYLNLGPTIPIYYTNTLPSN